MGKGIGVLTGAASGIGRELALKLAEEGYDLAICDVDESGLENVIDEIREYQPERLVMGQVCDVADRSQVEKFRTELAAHSKGAQVTLLVNNAGIVGGSSFFKDSERQWTQTFDVTWGGVYNCCRVFLPLLQSAESAIIVNISSTAGFWASSAHCTPQSAYSTAKFAVKGFTESLIVDSRVNAPSIRPILVMLGAVSTKLSLNSQKYLGYKLPEEMSDAEIEEVRKRLVDPMKSMPVGELRNALQAAMAGEQSNAPTSAQEAAALIVDAIKGEDWRVVIGPGAKLLDGEVRNDPMHAYESDFYDNLLKKRDQLVNST